MTEHVVVVGTDAYDIADAIAAEGYTVERVDIGNRPALKAAALVDARVYVLTEVQQATSIPVAKELNPDLRIVVYADGTLPDFVLGQADIALDPDLFTPEDVAAELVLS